MFMRGGRIKGDFPHIEGTGRAVRFMRFADVAHVDARASELTAVVRAWCAAMAPKKASLAARLDGHGDRVINRHRL
jgi:hypothetical protein